MLQPGKIVKLDEGELPSKFKGCELSKEGRRVDGRPQRGQGADKGKGNGWIAVRRLGRQRHGRRSGRSRLGSGALRRCALLHLCENSLGCTRDGGRGRLGVGNLLNKVDKGVEVRQKCRASRERLCHCQQLQAGAVRCKGGLVPVKGRTGNSKRNHRQKLRRRGKEGKDEGEVAKGQKVRRSSAGEQRLVRQASRAPAARRP
mmetsp:Transcript_4776/g.15446  ORF Transcript_4776/g.15446 Transcript_4776/m.15446 type:complete len:202 (-) Transcript_4776:116-721(-)